MTPKQVDALKLALEALRVVTKEMMAIRDELAEYGEGRPITNGNHQLLWDSSFKAYTETAIPAYAALEKALAEHAMRETQRLGQEIEQAPYSVQQAYAMAQVCLDLHEAIGCKWGDNVYFVIDQLKAAAPPPQRKPLTDDLYNELLFAVGNKYPNETRHQTALRYILQAEKGDEKAAHGIKENT